MHQHSAANKLMGDVAYVDYVHAVILHLVKCIFVLTFAGLLACTC